MVGLYNMIESNLRNVWKIDNQNKKEIVQNYDSSVKIIDFIKYVIRLHKVSGDIIKSVHINVDKFTKKQLISIRNYVKKTKSQNEWVYIIKHIKFECTSNKIEFINELLFFSNPDKIPKINQIIDLLEYFSTKFTIINDNFNMVSGLVINTNNDMLYVIDPVIINHGINIVVHNEFVIDHPNINLNNNNDLLSILGKSIFDEIINNKDKSEEEINSRPIKKRRITKTYDDEIVKNYFKSLNSIDDILKLPDDCDNVIIQKLCDLKEPLTELNNMLGIDEIKSQIFDIIIYYIQKEKIQKHQRLHTVIYGKPGTGKTTFANIYSKILCNMGVLKSNVVHSVKSHQLIGQYVGQTAPLTQKAIDKAMGGVLFIDEAYSIGSSNGKGKSGSSFSEDCINILNQNLTEKGDEFVCVLAGYKDDIENSFFRMNDGLKRRFNFYYDMKELEPKQLFDLFFQKLTELNYVIGFKKEEGIDFFEKKKISYSGGTIENLITKIEFEVAKRCLNNMLFLKDGEDSKNKNKIELKDLTNAYNKIKDKSKIKEINTPMGMYI